MILFEMMRHLSSQTLLVFMGLSRKNVTAIRSCHPVSGAADWQAGVENTARGISLSCSCGNSSAVRLIQNITIKNLVKINSIRT